jgi:L-fuculose-phosphate aldolase
MWHSEIKSIGEKLLLLGLNNSHSGNISVKDGDVITITRTHTMLDSVGEKNLIEVPLVANQKLDKQASSELIVHRAIYESNPKVSAIVHAHPPHAIVVADKQQEIIPYDAEGKHFLTKIPVLRFFNPFASTEVATAIKKTTGNYHAAIIEKHGVFAWGESLEEAYHYMTVVESVCKINYLLGMNNATQNH